MSVDVKTTSFVAELQSAALRLCDAKRQYLAVVHEKVCDLASRDLKDTITQEEFVAALKYSINAGVTQTEIAAASGMTVAGVGKWLKEQNPSVTPNGFRLLVMQALAEKLTKKMGAPILD